MGACGWGLERLRALRSSPTAHVLERRRMLLTNGVFSRRDCPVETLEATFRGSGVLAIRSKLTIPERMLNLPEED